ncbi:actin-binding Rho-activating protein-like [Pollicipes pollicipes]|uniref:actin-binding Rho-activating protein-like n=1 Tax=Pollicipes pollicipes TaxID=41117 RepID=UPI001884F8DE|nr:actin-binding Rho-activating protein-like [Pollicipes pollicipes]XP_037075380.1 actin-binding Rho-activating protein-like [Pollicipes pollicipes]
MAPVSVQQFEKAVEGLKKMAKEQPADVVPMPAGEKKEKKGLFGVKHAHTELLELCNMIYDEGFKYSDGTVAIPFGILFKVYSVINNRVVGLLAKARKYGLLYFEGEMLYQVRDDDKPIMLLKPIEKLRQELSGLN